MRRMSGFAGASVVVLALGVAVLAPSSAHAVPPPELPWTEYLPALPSPSQAEPNRVAHCREPRLKCVRVQIARMRALRDRLGCDFKAVFATTYLELTKVLRDLVKAAPEKVRQPNFFFREDALFANVYFRTVRAWEQGRVGDVPPAWRTAFETAEGGEVFGVQDMLLGINAHVQNDMPFVLAQLGLRDRQGRSRKPDHDYFNKALNLGYEPVVQAVAARYDPNLSQTNPESLFHDDVVGLELARLWREQVWRNAERLVNARDDAERDRIAEEIQAYAASWAQGLAAVPSPGVRAQRIAYCERQLGG